MAGAGYNPIEMARFFEKLEAEGGSRAPQFLSSHPNPGNRVEDVQAEIRTFPQGTYDERAGTGSFQEAKQLVARLPEPDRQVQRARAAPANNPSFSPEGISRMKTLNARPFSMAYPQEWGVYGDRNADTLTIAPRQGLVENQFGGASVGYGTIVGYYYPSRRATSVDQATRDLLSQLRASNPTMQVEGGFRNVRVDGAPGLVTTLTSASPFGGTERDVLLTVARPEGLFYMVFIAPNQYFDQAQSAFDRMLQSIRFRG
jgi:hypothetical protein